MDHERPAAHVAVRAEELLPEMLDAGRVLAVEQLEQRFGQGAGDLRLEPVTSPQPVILWLVSILK